MSLQASRIFAPGIHHDPGNLPPRSPAIPGSIWVPRIIKEPFVENVISGCGLWGSEVVSPATTLIERERISIKSLSAPTRGFLGCPREKGESAYGFPNRTR